MNPQPGLRERKKQRTRETIARAAHELFAERGYHATTLPDIAEAADVSTRTIFAYFPSKEDILFSDFPIMKEALAQALAERPEGEDALETVRKFILSLHEFEKTDLDEQMRRVHRKRRDASQPPAGAARPARGADRPGDREGSRCSRRRPSSAGRRRLAHRRLQRPERARRRRRSRRTPPTIAALIDPVITFLRGGLDALKEPSRR